MARIRTVKPEFWADEKISKLPRDARLLFIGMFNFADDAGRMRGNPLLIRAQVFPYDADIDSESLLRTLAEASLIVRYEVATESYIWICNFNKHQKIDKPTDSVLPGPETASAQTLTTHSPTTRRALVEESCLEGKGKEGKGSGNGVEPPAPQAAPASAFQAFLKSEWPDIKNPAECEQRSKEAHPGLDLLAEAKKARAWETANPRKAKSNHGNYFYRWLSKAEQFLAQNAPPDAAEKRKADAGAAKSLEQTKQRNAALAAIVPVRPPDLTALMAKIGNGK